MRGRAGWAVLLWALCGVVAAAVPERPRLRIAGPAQGLPSSEIKALAHDRAGYLWIATADGLARYDGVGMQVWRHDPADPGSLPGNNVQALLVDARDRLWAATEDGGVAVLDARRERFARFREAPATRPPDDVWAMARQGALVWLGTYQGGLVRVDAAGRTRRFEMAQGLPSSTVLALAVDAQGLLWVGTDKGLARQQGDAGFQPVALPGAGAAPMVYALARQPDGMWVGTSQGVWLRAGETWRQPDWSALFQRPNALMAIATDRHGDRWIGSQRGLWRQHGKDAPMPVRMGGVDMPRVVLALSMQADGALWVPVGGRGLGYLRADWRDAAQLAGPEDGLHGAMYRALAVARDGGAWLAGVNGTVERIGTDGAVRNLPAAVQERLRAYKPSAVMEDAAGRLWVGYRGGLLRVAEGVVDAWHADDARDPLPAGQMVGLASAPDGTVWLAVAGGGVQQRDPGSGRVLRDLPANDASGLGDADIEAMVIAPGGEPWIAGSTGVLRFDPAAGRFRRVVAMGEERVHALAFDAHGGAWLQRLSGLAHYRRAAGGWALLERVDARQGMPALAAAGLAVDARQRVWIATSRGLYRWEPGRRRVHRIGIRDGGGEEILDRAVLLRPDGVLMAATADGSVLLVDTAAPDPPPLVPALRIAPLAVRRDGDWRALADGRGPGREDRELRIGARLLAFDDPPGNRYWARLDGFDRGWVALGASGERVFTGLAPGRYTLRMRAQDANGNPATEQRLHFAVPPPWWRTPWALGGFLSMALLGIAILALGLRARLRRRHAWQLTEQRRALAEQASRAKSDFLATLGHEVRTPMTGVLGMAELLQGSVLDRRQRSQVDAIRRAGEHLLRLVNDALDLARIEAGKLELADADFALRPLLDEVAGLMAPVAERKGLAFVEGVAADAPLALHGDRMRVQQILLNLVGNAVKVTDTGHVALETFVLRPQGVRLVVADSGPGLDAGQCARLFRRFEQADGARTAARHGGSGLGLAISQELAAAMGGRIGVESEPGKGTRFIVDLPLPAAALPAPSPETPTAAAARSLLLVEDDPTVADAIAGLLQAQGHVVVHAAHGLAALAELPGCAFDAALLDLDLPGMDGLALARLLRSRGVQVPLLAITARSDADAEPQARAAGFDGFLRKPVTGAMLAQALDALMGEKWGRSGLFREPKRPLRPHFSG